MTYRDDATVLPASAFSCDPAPADPPALDERLFADRDPAVFDYVVAAQRRFESLRQCAAQLGGLLVLAAAGGRTDPGHPMLELARNTHDFAADATFAAIAPPGAGHHHRHMLAAARNLTAALAAMPDALSKRDADAVDRAFQPLDTAFTELQAASRCLPGFEIVDFEQGCCAEHVGLRRSKRILMEQ
ncbi:hypothetical protein [Oricola nitratireducens]|uniref:hypothetical protein n=1 Tax=Oricola nitratireducens TaxID=2775868 RepID=UPI001867CA7F|nr:hypothetical protein [Oricola nitratireducens]